MNCLSCVSSYTVTIFQRTSHFIVRGSLHQCSTPLWKRNFENVGVKTVDLGFVFKRFCVRFYATQRASVKAACKKKLDLEPSLMEQEKDIFYVVRKGDVVGVYKSLNDCQAQIGSSICDPPVSIYKGHTLPKDTEEYLVSCGLRNALYTIRAADLKEDLFGTLMPCPFQHPASSREGTCAMNNTKKRSCEVLGSENVGADGSVSMLTNPLRKHVKLDNEAEAQIVFSDTVSGSLIDAQQHSCILEFDGAAKRNPGPAGAGAVLRADDGSLICRLQEGLGIATNNVAEYRAMILGLKYALKKGYTKIHIQGDSKLVCSQVQGLWKVRRQNLAEVYEQVKELKNKFRSFQISHVPREFNLEADVQANLAIKLANGQVHEEFK